VRSFENHPIVVKNFKPLYYPPKCIIWQLGEGCYHAVGESPVKRMAGRDVKVNAIIPGFIHTDLTADLVNDPGEGASLLARIPLSAGACQMI
jgi:hypothetical protein